MNTIFIALAMLGQNYDYDLAIKRSAGIPDAAVYAGTLPNGNRLYNYYPPATLPVYSVPQSVPAPTYTIYTMPLVPAYTLYAYPSYLAPVQAPMVSGYYYTYPARSGIFSR